MTVGNYLAGYKPDGLDVTHPAFAEAGSGAICRTRSRLHPSPISFQVCARDEEITSGYSNLNPSWV